MPYNPFTLIDPDTTSKRLNPSEQDKLLAELDGAPATIAAAYVYQRKQELSADALGERHNTSYRSSDDPIYVQVTYQIDRWGMPETYAYLEQVGKDIEKQIAAENRAAAEAAVEETRLAWERAKANLAKL